MADSTKTIAVESAVQADAAASLASSSAAVAIEAAETATEAATDAVMGSTVILAEQAVEIAHNEATIANQQAAMVTQAAVEAIAENEVKESWQDEAIKRLSAESETNSMTLRSLAEQLQAMTEALALITAPSQPLTSEQSETPPTVTSDTEPTKTEPPLKSEAENPDKRTEARKRILRFL